MVLVMVALTSMFFLLADMVIGTWSSSCSGWDSSGRIAGKVLAAVRQTAERGRETR